MFQKLFRRSSPLASPPQPNGLEDIDKQVKRLAKEIYKTNTLAESQVEQTRQAVELVKAALGELQNTQRSNQDAVQAVRIDAVKALFPVIDSVEAAINSGSTMLNTFTEITPEIVGALRGWLDGQRLILQRLESILQAEGIQRIQTVGQPFDPRFHVAVSAAYDAVYPAGVVSKEERRGYIRGSSVLRYADVIVNRGEGDGM
jgi:molecular chaperone GrpE